MKLTKIRGKMRFRFKYRVLFVQAVRETNGIRRKRKPNADAVKVGPRVVLPSHGQKKGILKKERCPVAAQVKLKCKCGGVCIGGFGFKGAQGTFLHLWNPFFHNRNALTGSHI